MQAKYKGYEKLAFFGQYLALFRKQYKIQLQWKTNRNSYAIYRMVPFLITFNDRLLRFQGHDILNVK